MLEERYCAFIDILGFSELVRSISGKNAAARKAIFDRLLTVNACFKKEAAKLLEDCPAASLSHFSDSIFISIPCSEKDSLGSLFYFIQRLVTALIIEGFLTRGAIVRGHIFHKDSIVFGPAIVEAYRLESKIAKYPRIVVATNVTAKIEDAEDGPAKVLPSTDGPAYLNCLQLFEKLAHDVQKSGVRLPKETERIGFLRRVREFLQFEIVRRRDEPEIHQKFRWISRELNERALSVVTRAEAGWPKCILLTDMGWKETFNSELN